eukprot:TRINITY_DN182_c0_g1_i4.p1 TRINITY_DN182_c0_g1~~TRINITY_DN182_c0_g1_i4.p1  ORF type:complete len:195 (-),score=18.25 TRINITY_DN182_c0_g1_i4:133-648(-)
MIWVTPACPGASMINASTSDTCASAFDVFGYDLGIWVKILCSVDEEMATASVYNDGGCLDVNQTGDFPKGECTTLPFSLVPNVVASAIVKCGTGCLDVDACNYDAGFYTHNQSACDYTNCGSGCGNMTACNYNNPDFDPCYFEGDPECGGCSSLNPTFGLFMLLLLFVSFF